MPFNQVGVSNKAHAMRAGPTRSCKRSFLGDRERSRSIIRARRPVPCWTACWVLLAALLLCSPPLRAFTICSNQREIISSRRGLSVLNNENHDVELERYRNRSLLLENALKHKLEALKLSDKKLVVLQDAVKRLVKKQEKEQEHREKEMEQLHNNTLNEKTTDIELWKSKFSRSERARLEASNELDRLKQQFTVEKSRHKKERDELIGDIKELQSAYEKDQKVWRETNDRTEVLEKDLQELETKYKASMKEAKLLKKTAAGSDRKLPEALENSRTRIEQLESQIAKASSRGQTWKEKYILACETVQQLEEKLLEAQNATGSPNESVGQEDKLQQLQTEHDEAMEIAQSAVAAAERREKKLQQELEESKSRSSNLLAQKTDLQRLFEELKDVQSSEERHSKSLQFQLDQLQKDYAQLVAQKTHLQRRVNVLQSKVDNLNKEVAATTTMPSTQVEPTAATLPQTKRESLQDILEIATQIVGDKPHKKSTKERIVDVASALRPGRVGQYLEEHHMTFEKGTTSRWRYIKNLLPRIPFRIVRRSRHEQ